MNWRIKKVEKKKENKSVSAVVMAYPSKKMKLSFIRAGLACGGVVNCIPSSCSKSEWR